MLEGLTRFKNYGSFSVLTEVGLSLTFYIKVVRMYPKGLYASQLTI